jgi:hypothetical protein
MKNLVIIVLALNLIGLTAHAGAPVKASQRDSLGSVKYGRTLCRWLQGFWSQPAGSKGTAKVNTQCDRFVRENYQLDYVHMALAICKSPDLDGQDRGENNIGACFEGAASMLGQRHGNSEQEAWNGRFLSLSDGCQGKASCLKDVFEKTLKDDQKFYATPATNVWQANGGVTSKQAPPQAAPSTEAGMVNSANGAGPQIHGSLQGFNSEKAASEPAAASAPPAAAPAPGSGAAKTSTAY